MSRSIVLKVPVKIPTAVIFSEAERNRMGKFALTFDLLEILPRDRMLQLVKDKMIEAGFEQTEQGLKMPIKPDEAQAIFDLETMTMNLKGPLPQEVVMSVNQTDEKGLTAAIHRALEDGSTIATLAAGTGHAADEALNVAEKGLELMALAAKRTVNKALKEVYREAIKEKAASIGNVVGVTENKEGSTYRIRVEISD